MEIDAIDPGLPVWLLVDPVLGEPLPAAVTGGTGVRAARESAWGRPVHAVELANGVLQPPQQPYLVAMEDAQDPWLPRTRALARAELEALGAAGIESSGRGPLAMGGWLQAAVDADTLARSLAELFTLRQRLAGGARHLRLADPRTRAWLDVVVGRDAWAGALGPLRRWVWIDAGGDVVILEGTEPAKAPAAPRFTAAQWERFALAAFVHPAFARWQGALPPQRRARNSAQVLLRVAAEVETALLAQRRHPRHLPAADDVVAHVVLALLHAGLTDTAAYRRWLAQDSQAEDFVPLNDCCAALHAELTPSETSAA